MSTTQPLDIPMTKDDVLKEIAASICNCFGNVDLEFRSGISGEGSATGMKSLAKRWGLTKEEIRQAIYPVLKDWLDNRYTGFGENKPRPWNEDANARRLKASQMATGAAWYFSEK